MFMLLFIEITPIEVKGNKKVILRRKRRLLVQITHIKIISSKSVVHTESMVWLISDKLKPWYPVFLILAHLLVMNLLAVNAMWLDGFKLWSSDALGVSCGLERGLYKEVKKKSINKTQYFI